MATKLKNMHLTSVDLVRFGANQEADICLFKSETPPQRAEAPTEEEMSLFGKFVRWLKTVCAEPQTDAEEEWEDAEEKGLENAEKSAAYAKAFAKSVQSIHEDVTITPDQKIEMIQKSINEFTEAVESIEKSALEPELNEADVIDEIIEI